MKEIRKPNLNGPRFREKRISILTANTLKKFKEKYPEYNSLSLTMFKDIIMTFNSLIVDGIIGAVFDDLNVACVWDIVWI